MTNPTPQNIADMFDSIAHSYDRANRILSFGTDISWRKKLISLLPCSAGLSVLDLATGTGDLAIAMCKERRNIGHVDGLDVSEGMLEQGRAKVKSLGLEQMIRLSHGDAHVLPTASASIDAVTVAFGVRNFSDLHAGLKEMKRVLKPQGIALILEFSLPRLALLRIPYLFYFRYVLPVVGGLVSGNQDAYKYLNQSVEAFPYGEKFCSLVRDAGFSTCRAHILSGGIATIYEARVST